jgi:hypothetical protein
LEAKLHLPEIPFNFIGSIRQASETADAGGDLRHNPPPSATHQQHYTLLVLFYFWRLEVRVKRKWIFKE